jgi:hypothetical protein
MTLSDEGGELAGAILFYMIHRGEGQPPRSSPGLPEPMFHLRFEGKELDFRVSHRRAHPPRTADDPPMRFRLKITGPDEGVLVREDGTRDEVQVSRDK